MGARLLVLSAALIACPYVGQAQSITGKVLDAGSGVPLGGVRITLLSTGDTAIAVATTDILGNFVMTVRHTGRFRLRAARIGYDSLSTKPFVLLQAHEANVELRLAMRPIELAAVDAVGAATSRLTRVGFYARRSKGFGQFLTANDLDELHPVFHEDLFRGMSGIRVLLNGTVVSTRFQPPCALSIAIDGVLVQQGRDSLLPWTALLHVSDIEAVEVYPSAAGAPPWLFGPVSRCGAIVVWTKGSL